VRLYPPSTLTIQESLERLEAEERLGDMDVSDATIMLYAQEFLRHYRATIDRFFASLAPHLPLYARHPFEISILRIDSNGVIICYRPGKQASVRLVHEQELKSPLARISIFDIKERWNAIFMMFDFSVRTYDGGEAEIKGVGRALADALYCFWMAITKNAFGELALEFLRAEKVNLESEICDYEREHFDALGEVLLTEAAGFRRSERWAFQFKDHKNNRVTVGDLHELETYLNEHGERIDVICLITSGDLTSIGNNIVVSNPRIRLWDRDVLDRLVHEHLEVLEKYFTTYPFAIETLNKEHSLAEPKRLKEFQRKLLDCQSGQRHFSQYERLGIEIWCYLFNEELGEPKIQRGTSDRVERRDVLFRNMRRSSFFQRVSDRFDADFVILDFKNHLKPVNSGAIKQASLYANKALGRFVIIVSRKGNSASAVKAQHRFLEKETIVLSVSDDQMLEMIARKERGENPADLLSDLLDDLLIGH